MILKNMNMFFKILIYGFSVLLGELVWMNSTDDTLVPRHEERRNSGDTWAGNSGGAKPRQERREHERKNLKKGHPMGMALLVLLSPGR